MELEDDLFFADLSKQISLLIMDDDEDKVEMCPSVSSQTFPGGNHPIAPSPVIYQQNCKRESKGTGVFIPQSSQPRRKNRQGRYGSCNSKSTSHRQQDNNARMISQVSYCNNSFNSKKG
ncbi:hypothetical protein K2173_022520 [Erythroxylum novogranatense]|uniref:Uncharacterized protein n=1 Tax=Erythroxylum novogranatense TaxID=1862640 RepID=A0AAV8THY5_9ROSI|nr:hypothetical protein K2173_022520 [Erythroxylum novogranatense]